MTIRVGIDAGGTFTDFVLDDGRTLKVPSRPTDPASLVRDVLAELGAGRCEVVLSTTAATNALLERRGGPTKLFTTAGFEDVLEIARQQRAELYALAPTKPMPLLDATDRHGVDERVAVDGAVLRALSEEEIARCVALVPEGTTVAICFLHSYAHPAHEQRLAAALRARGVQVSVSSEVAPLPREYERSSTTVIDAYVGPALGQTIAQLRHDVSLRVMESTGGARAGAPRPARTVLSGPAAGVVAAEQLCARLGLRSAVALDIGGTSTDVALLRGGRAERVEELVIAGLPIALPSVAVRTAGAGGGSIAWVDAGGVLKIGPRSAGAEPGPASYARGGVEPTVTDAHVVLGRLGDSICGGSVALDRVAATASLAGLATSLGISASEAARAVVAVMDAAVARAVGAAALGEARDELTLIAYGGAAGLHVVETARRAGIGRVIVPPAPGLFCARGALEADVVVERLFACRETVPPSAGSLARLEILTAEVEAELAAEVTDGARGTVLRAARLRYAGQGIDGELELDVDAPDLAGRFVEAHLAARGFVLERPIEVTSLRARGRIVTPVHTVSASRPSSSMGSGGVDAALPGGASDPRSREVDGVAVPLYSRGALHEPLEGPAIIEEPTSTLWLPDGARVRVDESGNLHVAVGA